MLFISSRLLAQQAPTPADQASGLMVTFLTFIMALAFVVFGVQLLRSGIRPEKTGVEFMGFKMNLESTTGGILIVGAIVTLYKFYGHYYGG